MDVEPVPLRPGMCRLMLITNRHLCEQPLESVVKSAMAGGVDAVQVREKDFSGRALYELTAGVVGAVAGKGLVVVNGRLDVALAAGAGGVQLGRESIPVARARAVVPKGFVIGYSAHGIEEALAAEKSGADYVTLSPVFETGSKPGAQPIGCGALSEAVKRLSVPVIALGGVNASNAEEVGTTGAAGMAVISAVCAARDPEAAARALLEAFERGAGKR